MLIATEMLRNEHERILPMLQALEDTALAIEQNGTFAPHELKVLTEFFAAFVGGAHREHEEALLFPALEKKGLRRSVGLMGNLQIDHEEVDAMLRHLVRHAEAFSQGLAESAKNWALVARDLVALLRGHIRKENEVLYVLADHMLSDQEQMAMADEIERAHRPCCAPEADLPSLWFA